MSTGGGIRRRAADLSRSMSAALSAELNRRWQLWRDVRNLASAPDDSTASTAYRALVAEHSDDPRYAADLVQEIRRKIASEEDSAARIRAERQQAPTADPSLASNLVDRVQDTFEANRQARLARLRHLASAGEPGDGHRRPSGGPPEGPRRSLSLRTSKAPDLGARWAAANPARPSDPRPRIPDPDP